MRSISIVAIAMAASGIVLAGALAQSGNAIPEPFTDEPGDIRRGMTVAANTDLGNCIICHHIPLPDVPAGAFGSVGPSLAGVGSRLSEGELRLRIVDSSRINPATVMPPYHRTEGLERVADEHAGEPILTAQQVEDLIAFLQTLTDEAQ
ncbi:sulfur oxidation c-type cytochrome SoxX [Pelagibacterium sp. H642]|uniref:sulfur oxidation c-type cytochrome SoxX n=1 Tax=Pelagibacterium sp. H642 TaxID=1881069 RepID=UPI0028159575|nr:sulfur oxidation c-type cytochrome SoxX [Pelagibacterium sp. H642]WMT90874.1 sulfur oxidation c-type cytochrome SoxX [Pelagibacterium sp. H642]